MNPCWVLIVTRGLRVWLPPEVYLQHPLAIREAERWRSIFAIRTEPPPYSPRARCTHLVRTELPDPWRACPVWVGVTWSLRSYPRLKLNLMAADDQGAVEWLRPRTPRESRLERPGQLEFERRGVPASAGIFRVKRVMGF